MQVEIKTFVEAHEWDANGCAAHHCADCEHIEVDTDKLPCRVCVKWAGVPGSKSNTGATELCCFEKGNSDETD